ncbi:MAG: TonB-dependent receptor, partial [Gemmatimonadota bacterium]|nr:TonB-dependent receptor [Gemmatimonadota bacterium]
QAYGPGLGNVAAFVPSGIDTVVTETLFDGSTRQVTIPSFARATGSCESADNGGRSCEGRRLPYDWSTDLSLSGNIAWRYGRGSSLRITVVGHAAQDRFWPGALSFNPAAYAGRRTAGTTWILAWRHALGGADGGPIVQVAASRQTARTTSGTLDPAWEPSHRDPTLGIALDPMDFLVNFDRFSADTGAGAVTRLASDADWDQLIQNVVTNSGTRVPYLDRNDLRLTQPFRMNPWAAATGFPTEGLAGPLERSPALASESHWIGRAVVTVPVARVHRVRAGADVTHSRVRAFSSALISQNFMSVYSEDPVQAGLFAEARLVVGGLTVDGGLRWDTFDPRTAFPVVPGRIFTHPNFDPTDPYDPADSVFAPAASRTALSPRVRVAFDGFGPVSLRLGYAEQARHPDLTAMFTGKNRDLSFSNTLTAFGQPLDWERSRHLEAGVRVAVGSRLAVDAVGFHVAKKSDAVLRLETFFDPVILSDLTITVPVNVDTGSVKGVELTVLSRLTGWLNVQLGYSLADARGTLQTFANRKHTLAGWAVARWPDDARAPAWPSRLLQGGEAALRFRWSSGLPYSPLINQGFGTVVPPATFGPARGERTDMPGVTELDLRVTRAFRTGGVRWGVFVDVRNLFNWRNTYRVFAETDGLENDVHRTLLIDPELARLQNEAGAQWTQVTKDGRTVFAADLTGDCAAWSGGPVNCVLLRRAEARWGNGDGFYDVEEARAGFDAMYDLFFGPWAFLGLARQARVGVEIRF